MEKNIPTPSAINAVLTETPTLPNEKPSFSTQLVNAYEVPWVKFVVLLLLSCMLFATTFFVAYQKRQKEKETIEIQKALYEVPQAKMALRGINENNTISTNSLKEYKSEALGISFMYPAEFEVEQLDPFNIKIGIKENLDPAGNTIAASITTRFYLQIYPASSTSTMDDEISKTDIYEYKQAIEDIVVDGIPAKKVMHSACQSADCINVFLLINENLYQISSTNGKLDQEAFSKFLSSIKFIN
jgi:PsbP-like protein